MSESIVTRLRSIDHGVETSVPTATPQEVMTSPPERRCGVVFIQFRTASQRGARRSVSPRQHRAREKRDASMKSSTEQRSIQPDSSRELKPSFGEALSLVQPST